MTVTSEQAKDFWIERANGAKIRDICAKHNVDPRRLYEVFEGEVHPDSLAQARNELAVTAPHLVGSERLKFHEPSRRVVRSKQHDPSQGTLF